MAASALLIDTDILIDYLKSIQPACALLDSTQFDFYYSSWSKKELLAKPGLKESERQEIEVLLGRFRINSELPAALCEFFAFFAVYLFWKNRNIHRLRRFRRTKLKKA